MEVPGLASTYSIIYPSIPTAGVYLFTTDSGVQYEVRFGRKQDNILHVIIVFGVTNDEYNGEEYIETNKGEHYHVLATIVEIVKNFRLVHPNVRIYEFSGLARPEETDEQTTIRLQFYKRYLSFIFEADDWEVVQKANVILVNKKKESR